MIGFILTLSASEQVYADQRCGLNLNLLCICSRLQPNSAAASASSTLSSKQMQKPSIHLSELAIACSVKVPSREDLNEISYVRALSASISRVKPAG